jgi:hypothetical protein
VKRALFRSERVSEYWVVDLESRTFERSTPDHPRVEVIADQLRWMPEGVTAPLVIDVLAYFAGVLDD